MPSNPERWELHDEGEWPPPAPSDDPCPDSADAEGREIAESDLVLDLFEIAPPHARMTAPAGADGGGHAERGCVTSSTAPQGMPDHGPACGTPGQPPLVGAMAGVAALADPSPEPVRAWIALLEARAAADFRTLDSALSALSDAANRAREIGSWL